MSNSTASRDIGQNTLEATFTQPDQQTLQDPKNFPNSAALPQMRFSKTNHGGRIPPRSRASTASFHSATTQYNTDHHVAERYQQYVPADSNNHSHMFNSNPEDMILRFGEQLASTNSGHDISGNGIILHVPSDLSSHPVPGSVPHQYHATMYDNIESQTPDRMMAHMHTPEPGIPRLRRGTTSTVANDNELRRLLRQYDGYTLHQMAVEVQKHDGAGGKSEKIKQVFAMIWLRENCQKSSSSVRRDRVYCCYADTCGTERVSVLNPASFGKLVRIIFPNVQTRRLGVRGESKYHYVDLSLKHATNTKKTSVNTSSTSRNSISISEDDHESNQQKNSHPNISHALPETLFPSTPHSSNPKFTSSSGAQCTCRHDNTRSILKRDDSITEARQMIERMLLLPEPTNSRMMENDDFKLPNIREYLPLHTDLDIADALSALYRSHCISVIDSFRFCKEKSFFRHFASFQGTLTVPVLKLSIHKHLAPWIEECDWMMYQKMVAFVAPLTTQIVPGQVLNAFGSISNGLVAHITDTLKSHPEHVSMARLVPARVFCHLLKRMLDVNQAANAAAAWLCQPVNRTRMWEDYEALIDPFEIASKANIPTCSAQTATGLLGKQVRRLLTPDNAIDSGICSQDPLLDFSLLTGMENENPFPDRWIALILQLPFLFPNHSASCMIQKADASWNAILHRLTLGGAESFSAWWMAKVFFSEMISWQAEKGGFMHYRAKSLRQNPAVRSSNVDGGSFQLLANESEFPGDPNETSLSPMISNITRHSLPQHGTYDGKSHPEKTRSSLSSAQQNTGNDDSAIDLGDDSVLGGGKYGDIMVSDLADTTGDVVVV